VSASKDWKEVIAEGEDAKFLALAERLAALQKKNAEGGKLSRGLHAKAHAGVKATFTVRRDVPPYAAQGLFATPAKYDAYVRFSNGSGRRAHDKVDDVRGIALKIVGVPGKKIIPPLADCVTQDFLLIQTPTLAFRTPEEFVSFIEAASGGQALLLPRLILALGPFRPFSLLKDLIAGLKAAPSAALQRYHSAAPIAFGPYAAKLDLVPQNTGHAATPKMPDHYAEDLSARLAAGPLEYTLRAQFFVDEERTPLESPSALWSEDASPFISLADLVLLQQDVTSAEGRARAERVESLSFDPWHALVEHRPLGAVMRARNHAYRLSTTARGAASEPTEVS
jgi:hypothetical protein